MKARVTAEGISKVSAADEAEWKDLKESLDKLNTLALKYRETIDAARDMPGEDERRKIVQKNIYELFMARSEMRKSDVVSDRAKYAELLLQSKTLLTTHRRLAPVLVDAVEVTEVTLVNGLPEEAGGFGGFGKPVAKSEPVIKLETLPKELLTYVQIAPPSVEGTLDSLGKRKLGKK